MSANIHAGAVQTYQTACVRAGSHFTVADDMRDGADKVVKLAAAYKG